MLARAPDLVRLWVKSEPTALMPVLAPTRAPLSVLPARWDAVLVVSRFLAALLVMLLRVAKMPAVVLVLEL